MEIYEKELQSNWIESAAVKINNVILSTFMPPEQDQVMIKRK